MHWRCLLSGGLRRRRNSNGSTRNDNNKDEAGPGNGDRAIQPVKTADSIPLSPFLCSVLMRRLSRPEFDQMLRLVMAQVFACHNELRRPCDEAVCQDDI